MADNEDLECRIFRQFEIDCGKAQRKYIVKVWELKRPAIEYLIHRGAQVMLNNKVAAIDGDDPDARNKARKAADEALKWLKTEARIGASMPRLDPEFKIARDRIARFLKLRTEVAKELPDWDAVDKAATKVMGDEGPAKLRAWAKRQATDVLDL